MQLKRRYERTRFSEKAIHQAAEEFDKEFGAKRKLDADSQSLYVEHEDCKWRFDSEQEFFAAYAKGSGASCR